MTPLAVPDREHVLRAITTEQEITVPTTDAVDAVIADWEEGSAEVRGSPEFFVKGRGYFVRRSTSRQSAARLRIVPDFDGLNAFFNAVLEN